MAEPKFYSVAEFKNAIGASSLEVLTRTKDGKTTCFVQANNGKSYKAQSTLSLNKPLSFMHMDNESIDTACLINPQGGATTMGTL